jgi:hypothetical protein
MQGGNTGVVRGVDISACRDELCESFFPLELSSPVKRRAVLLIPYIHIHTRLDELLYLLGVPLCGGKVKRGGFAGFPRFARVERPALHRLAQKLF